jgi:probable rRNA maturation factor
MNPVIQITDRQRRLVLDREGIAALARWVLEREGCREGELSLLFTNNSRIRELNRRYLGRDCPTDVLAFPQDGPGGLLGDVAISTERVISQSGRFSQTTEDELTLCLIHGILHLFGWGDHPSRARAELQRREENLLESWKRRKRWSLIK